MTQPLDTNHHPKPTRVAESDLPPETLLIQPAADTCIRSEEFATVAHSPEHEQRPDRFWPQTIRYFGDYEILREIARGGMGVVYKARQVNLNRVVALKMILAGQLASDEDIKRFYTEAEAAAALEHPGIVPIFEIGQHQNQHFFSMGFVEGGSLADRIRQGPLPQREAAQLTQKIAEAISYAHEKGVIHRDLKPANVLVDLNGEPKITDFGLARKLEQDSGLTRTGAVLGTPSYMSPEQAAGKTSDVGLLSDVYSIGAILYCLLTGRPPFQTANPFDTMMQVLECVPVAPRSLNPEIDRDLDAICMKCLEKTPSNRYLSASALKDEIQKYQRGDPVSVRSKNPLARLQRALWHHRDDQALTAWGDLLAGFAPSVLLAELAVWWLGMRESEISHVYLWAGLIRAVQMLAMLAVIVFMKRRLMESRHAAARQMWSQWAAFLLSCHLVVVIKLFNQTHSEGGRSSLFWCYPYFSVLSGVLWFTLGSNFWGYCYLFGGLFFLESLAICLVPDMGPVVFGVMWFLLLLITARRLKKLAATVKVLVPPL